MEEAVRTSKRLTDAQIEMQNGASLGATCARKAIGESERAQRDAEELIRRALDGHATRPGWRDVALIWLEEHAQR